MIDHTELRYGAPMESVRTIADQARTHHCRACCVRPEQVPWIIRTLSGSSTRVCAAIGFRLLRDKYIRAKKTGEDFIRRYDIPLEEKVAEIDQVFDSVEQSGQNVEVEIDLLINVFQYVRFEKDKVKAEIGWLIETAKSRKPATIVKVIGENFWLNEEEKREIYTWAREAGADFVKTCSGFTSLGALVEDVRLIREVVGSSVGIKAAGGVNPYNYFDFLTAGVDRIGTSKAMEILEDFAARLETSAGGIIC
ncbi:hypothetical protein AUK40_00305 [Candidatus Wirthbacteria bacterium CG2_30_54_11]|uniref:Uncharacterized protein n=1 Tax=Candidatus Wirthbacteria bacterium CG2_30_54_11 TaxID=1817892 RepID=A0A1J5ISD8_9BACT|nr:MAG: hypothetical protein AUK40_00305 [Candidatus Wirthbacteria bacterium CG2_30_54_11]